MASPNYGATQMDQDLAPFARPQNPVVDDSSVFQARASSQDIRGVLSGIEGQIDAASGEAAGYGIISDAANRVRQGIASVAPIFSNAAKNQAEDAATGVLADYQSEQLLLADAVEQGSLDPSTARMRMRALHQKYLANNPSLVEDLTRISNATMSNAGLGQVIDRGNEQYQREKALIDKATADGWKYDGITEQQAVNAMLTHQRRVRDLSMIQEEIRTAQAQRGEVTQRMKDEATWALHSFAEASYPLVISTLENARTQVQGGADPATIIQNTRNQINSMMAQAGVLKAQGGDGSMDYLTSGVEKLMTEFENWATGKTNTEVWNAQREAILAQQKFILTTTNPNVARLVAMSEMFGHSQPAIFNNMADEVAQIFADAYRDPTAQGRAPDVIGTDAATGQALGGFAHQFEQALNNNTGEPVQQKAVGDMLTNLLRAAPSYSGTANNALDFQAYVEFWSKPIMAQAMEYAGETVSSDAAQRANYVLQQQYNEVLLPLVRTQYEEAITTFVRSNPNLGLDEAQIIAGWDHMAAATMAAPGEATSSTVETSTVVAPVWNGTGIEFQITDEALKDNLALQDAVKNLNTGPQSIAQPLNTLIRMTAHMQGNTNYQKAYEDHIAQRLWGNPDAVDPAEQARQMAVGALENPITVDDPKALSIADFNVSQLEQALANQGAADPAGMATASNSLQIAQSYLGLNENNAEQAQTLSQFIKRSTGTSINPAQTAWCAAFMNAVLHSSGLEGTGKLTARSFLMWGESADDNPQPGDVVVLSRGGSSWQGHVGFYMGTNPDGTIRVLGGNQGDAVSEDDYAAERVLGFRRASKGA